MTDFSRWRNSSTIVIIVYHKKSCKALLPLIDSLNIEWHFFLYLLCLSFPSQVSFWSAMPCQKRTLQRVGGRETSKVILHILQKKWRCPSNLWLIAIECHNGFLHWQPNPFSLNSSYHTSLLLCPFFWTIMVEPQLHPWGPSKCNSWNNLPNLLRTPNYLWGIQSTIYQVPKMIVGNEVHTRQKAVPRSAVRTMREERRGLLSG